MKFRYYITNTYAGRIEGTNDTKTAEDFASCEDYFVVDTETGTWITTGLPAEVVDVKDNTADGG